MGFESRNMLRDLSAGEKQPPIKYEQTSPTPSFMLYSKATPILLPPNSNLQGGKVKQVGPFPLRKPLKNTTTTLDPSDPISFFFPRPPHPTKSKPLSSPFLVTIINYILYII